MKKILGALAVLTLSPMLGTTTWAAPPLSLPESTLDISDTTSRAATLPLFTISLEAASQTINSYSVDFTAVLNTWSVNDVYQPAFSSHRVDFSVQPGHKDPIVMKSLEMKEAETPQALLDKMLIDGALTLNMTW